MRKNSTEVVEQLRFAVIRKRLTQQRNVSRVLKKPSQNSLVADAEF